MSKEQILSDFTKVTNSVIQKFGGIPDTDIQVIESKKGSFDNTANIKQLHDRFPTKGEQLADNYLYVIELHESLSEAAIKKVRKSFKDERNKKVANISRDNVSHLRSHTLYVGTSQSLKSRFTTHLGGNDGVSTWALYMKRWIGANKVIITTYQLAGFSDSEVQLIEDVTWGTLKPMFGKRGGK